MRIFKLTKETYTEFPDGQKIVTVPHLNAAGGELIEIQYVWKWDTVQCLIGAVKALKAKGHPLALKMPYMFGSRADRSFGPGQPNYMRDVMAPLINSLGFEYVRVLDPHSDVTEAVIPNLRKLDMEGFYKHVWSTSFGGMKCLVVPDAGAVKKSHDLAKWFQDVIYATKHRDIATGKILETKIDRLSGNCRHYVIMDDICDGGATFLGIARAIKKQDPEAVLYLCVTHGLFSKGLDELATEFKKIFTTNSVNPDLRSEFVLDVYNVW